MRLPSDSLNRLAVQVPGGVCVRIDGADVWAIFENESVDSQAGALLVQSAQPRLICRTSDVKDVGTRMQVQIDGVEYVVASNEPDGTGMSLILLERP
jgi:hypothetical protein